MCLLLWEVKELHFPDSFAAKVLDLNEIQLVRSSWSRSGAEVVQPGEDPSSWVGALQVCTLPQRPGVSCSSIPGSSHPPWGPEARAR